MTVEDRWHLNPRVLLAVIGWLFAATLAAIGWAWSTTVSMGDLRTQVAVVQSQVTAVRDDSQKQDRQVDQSLLLLRDDLREMRRDIGAIRDDLRASARHVRGKDQ